MHRITGAINGKGKWTCDIPAQNDQKTAKRHLAALKKQGCLPISSARMPFCGAAV
jgi:hypothetical protein